MSTESTTIENQSTESTPILEGLHIRDQQHFYALCKSNAKQVQLFDWNFQPELLKQFMSLLKCVPRTTYFLRAYPSSKSKNVYLSTDEKGGKHDRKVLRANFAMTFDVFKPENIWKLEQFVKCAYFDSASIGLVLTIPGKIKKGVTHGLALCTESDTIGLCDQGELLKEAFRLEPTFKVFTGSKSIHEYAVPNTPLQFGYWTLLQKDVAVGVGKTKADQSLWDAGQVMRCPGFIHPEADKLCEFHTIPEEPTYYTFEELRSIIPQVDHAALKTCRSSNTDTGEQIEYSSDSIHSILLQHLEEDIYPIDVWDSFEIYCDIATHFYDEDGQLIAANGERWRQDETNPIEETRGDVIEWYRCSNPFSPTNSSKQSLTISLKSSNLPTGCVDSSSGRGMSMIDYAIALEDLSSKDGKKRSELTGKALGDARIEMAKALYKAKNKDFSHVTEAVQLFREQCRVSNSIENLDTLDLSDELREKVANYQKLTRDELTYLKIARHEEAKKQIWSIDWAKALASELKGITNIQIAIDNVEILTGYKKDEIVNVEGILKGWNGVFWDDVDEAILKKRVDRILSQQVYEIEKNGKAVEVRLFRDAAATAKAYTSLKNSLSIASENFQQTPGINLLDGFVKLYDNGDHELVQHSPEFYCTSVVKTRYPVCRNREEKRAMHKLMKSIFQTISNEIQRDNLILSLAAVLNIEAFKNKSGKGFEGFLRCIIFSGTTGNNGKDTWRVLFTRLLGKGRVSNVGLKGYWEAIKGSGFLAAEVENKLCNWSTETLFQMIVLNLLDTLVADITGDERQFNHKHKLPNTGRFNGLQVHNGNDKIKITSASKAFIRRFSFIEVDGVYVDEDRFDRNNPLNFLQDTRFKHGEAENGFIDTVVMPAFIKLILVYYKRLFNGKRRMNFDYMDDAIKELVGDSSHIELFLMESEKLKSDKDSKISLKQLYAIYCLWCLDEGLMNAGMEIKCKLDEKIVGFSVFKKDTPDHKYIKGLIEKKGLGILESVELHNYHSDPKDKDPVCTSTSQFSIHLQRTSTKGKLNSKRSGKERAYFVHGIGLEE